MWLLQPADGLADRASPQEHEEAGNQVSNNRHPQRRTPADMHGRRCPGQICCNPGSLAMTWLRDEETASRSTSVAA